MNSVKEPGRRKHSNTGSGTPSARWSSAHLSPVEAKQARIRFRIPIRDNLRAPGGRPVVLASLDWISVRSYKVGGWKEIDIIEVPGRGQG